MKIPFVRMCAAYRGQAAGIVAENHAAAHVVRVDQTPGRAQLVTEKLPKKVPKKCSHKWLGTYM